MAQHKTPTSRSKAVLIDTPRSEMRKHYFLNEYVIFAPKRNLRPESFTKTLEPHISKANTCPFCRNEPTKLNIDLPNEDDSIRVVANAYPALSLDNPKAYGIQEVVIETTKHSQEFSDLSIDHIVQVFKVFIQRKKVLLNHPGIEFVEVFKNDGPKAGASIAHAHSQIAALPLVPPLHEQLAEAVDQYQSSHDHCPYCWIGKWEQKQKSRLIFSDKHITAIAPYSSTYGFEAWIMPNRHLRELADFSLDELTSLAVIMKKITAKLDSVSLSFNFILQESIDHRNHHMIIRIEPRYSIWAGLELGTGVIINPVMPEAAANWYRER